jgi:hypothetical protein
MKIIKRGRGRRYILPGERESTEDILKAIARASFEIAEAEDIERNRNIFSVSELAPSGSSSSWDESCMLPKARIFNPNAPVGETLLNMDHVNCVRCKTTVTRGRKYLHLCLYSGREEEVDMVAELASHYVERRVVAGLQATARGTAQ